MRTTRSLVPRLPVVAVAALLALGAAHATDPSPSPAAVAPVDSRIHAGPLVMTVHLSRTAQVFHVVDQLSAWSEFCHSQYADRVKLSDEEKEREEALKNWRRPWFTDQPGHLTAERIHGGIY